MLESARLRAERLILDKRIHNQRVALRQNWEITEMRNKDHHRAEVRTRLLAICCRLRAELNASQAALAEAEARGRRQGLEWQPIETAPKDETEVDLWVVDHLSGLQWRQPTAWWDETRWVVLSDDGEVREVGCEGIQVPTHFMLPPYPPLATAPAETQKPETGESHHAD